MSEKNITGKPVDSKTNKKTPKLNKQDREKLDPVRYGDWEKNGRCIDF